MPPRKSLPARTPTQSTPRSRSGPSTHTQSPNKRARTSLVAHQTAVSGRQEDGSPQKRSVRKKGDGVRAGASLDESNQELGEHEQPSDGGRGDIATDEVKKGQEVKPDLEAELEAWQDFAHEHYEMVEQLPLELHRNFRLLKELDDGCILQIDKLHELVRGYVVERLALERPASPAPFAEQEPPSTQEQVQKATSEQRGSDGRDDEMDVDVNPASAEDQADGTKDPKVPGEVDVIRPSFDCLVNGKQEAPGVPLPDGQGGLILSIPDQGGQGEGEREELGNPPRNEFPAAHVEQTLAEEIPPVEDADHPPTGLAPSTTSQDKLAAEQPARPGQENKKRKRDQGPNKHLPEIARLTREVVRTAEEKVAVAVGAYNAIDRHIRALDSALTAQEASILLGLRPATLPSANVDDSLNILSNGNGNGNGNDEGGAHAAAAAGPEEEVMTLGLGGGGGRKRKGKKKKGKVEEPPVEPVNVEGVFNIPADPNEPRYCYCNQVSYGEMIGCENDECPHEWFHLSCVGLTAPPTGRWYCNDCAPKDKSHPHGQGHKGLGTGKGGAGTATGAGPGARKAPPKVLVGRKRK